MAGTLLLDLEEIQPALDVAATEGQSVPFAIRLGPEHNAELLAYSWTLDDSAIPGEGPGIHLSTKGMALGTHIVKVIVTQGEETGRIAWRLQVAEKSSTRDHPPAILMSLPPSGRVVPRGEQIRLSVLAADVDAADALTYSWTVDGKTLSNTSGPGIELDTGSLALGSHIVRVEAKDGVTRPAAGAAAFSWTLDVAEPDGHSLPYLSGAWPQGNPRIHEAGRLRFEVEAVVPDSEDLIRYRWEVDGVLQPADGPFFHLEPPSAEGDVGVKSQRVTCRLLTGHEETGEVGGAVGWTVERGQMLAKLSSGPGGPNGAPVIEEFSPAATLSLEPGESRGLRVRAADPEGDILTYQWFVNGVRQPLDGPVFTATGSIEGADQTLHVDVRVSDGWKAGEGRSTDTASSQSSWDLSLGSASPLALTLSAGALIIDNGGAGTSFTGDWVKSSAAGAYGVESLYSKSSGSTYTYTFSVSKAGRYEVLLWWTAWDSRASAVTITTQHSQGTASASVNQTTGGGRWNSLGSFDFTTSAKVTIRAVGGELSTCADAACLNPASSASSPPPPAPAILGELLVDDGSSGTTSAGTWSPSSATGGYSGRSLYAKTSGSYTWQRSISTAGSYDVYAWWTEWSSRSSAAPYVIEHSNGSSTVSVDQRINGAKWNKLGRYTFDGVVKVTLKVNSASTFCADALRFVPAGAAIPPDDDGSTAGDIILDNGASGTSADGVWSASSAPNPYGSTSLYAKDRGAYVYDVRLPSAGKYGVYVWYTEWTSRDSAVPYEIQHSGGLSVVHLDQRSNGGRWSPLGDFTFGTTARITIRVVDANTVCADAIRMVPGGGAPSPTDVPEEPPPAGTGSKITELAAFPLTSDLGRVSWKTSFLGDSVVTYGTTTAANEVTRTVSGSRWDHSVLLEPLQADKLYYVKVRSQGSSTSANSEVVSFRTPDPTPGYTVTTSHPRIFMTQADITTIRSRLQSEPYATWWSKLIAFCNQQLGHSISEIRQDYPRTVLGLAFAGLIGDDASYRDKAIDVALSVAGLANTSDNKVVRDRIDFIIPVYDWLHAYLSSSEKSTLRSKLASYASILEDQVKETEYADGHSNGNENGAFLAALAIYGEDSSAAGVISRALVRYNEGFWPFWREQGSENGGSFKSGWYTSVATQFNFEVFAAWKSATGKNLFQSEKVWFEGLADWYLHSLRGDMSWDRHGDVVFQLGVDEIERHLFQLLAREYKNTDAQWLAKKVLDFLPVYGPDMIFDFLWHDASVAAKTPTQSTSRYFKGSGMVFMHESWKDDAVKAMFRAVPYYMGGHGHLDQCSFAIFYKEGLALDSGLYDDYGSSHHLNYYSRTIAHNAILVTDPAEVFKLYGNTQAADGGQYWLDPARVPHPFPEEIRDLTHDDAFHLGGMKTYEETGAYTYSLGDGTLSYNPTKMAAYFRHFLWIKSLSGWAHPVIVVFDEIEAKRSTYKKTYLLHTTNKPAVSGSLLNASSGSGRLYQRTVFPQTPEIVLVGGPGKEYWVKDRNYPPNRGQKSGEEPGAWRAEISPTVDRLHDEFLHILYPTDSSAGAPPSVRAIDAASMKGFESQGLVVLFAIKLESVTSVSFTLTGSRKNLLFGLSPLRSHDIYLDGAKQSTLTSSASGTLEFTNSGAGKVEVVKK